MKNDFFPQAVATMFSLMITMLIALVVLTSCNDYSRVTNNSLDNLNKTIRLKVADICETEPDYINQDVYIKDGKLALVNSEGGSIYRKTTSYDYDNENQLCISSHVKDINTTEVGYTSNILLGKDGWPIGYTTSQDSDGQSLFGDLTFSFYPNNREIQKISILRSDNQGIVKDREAVIEFFYEDEADTVSITQRWARCNPQLINDLTKCDGLGEVIAWAICKDEHALKRIEVKYALEDAISPGRINIEYHDNKVRCTHNDPGSVVMGGSNSNWTVRILTYYPR